jgi:ribosomal protein S12 methylthiotransferase accessory factor YcaO
MPASRPPADPDDAADAGPGEGFSAALLDLLDLLAERGDRLRLDDDAVVSAVAEAVERWLAARWANTPPRARPGLVLDAVRAALAAPGYRRSR